MKSQASKKSVWLFGTAAGTLAGSMLIAIRTISHRGPLVFLAYGAVMIGVAAWLHARQVPSFLDRVAATFSALTTTAILHEIYIHVVELSGRPDQIPFSGYAVRFGAMAGVVIVLSLAIAQVTDTRSVEAV